MTNDQHSRRSFLKEIASLGGAAAVMAYAGPARAAAPAAHVLGLPIGSQVYPHRELFVQDHVAAFRTLADIGIESVELCSPFNYAQFQALGNYTGAQLKSLLGDMGLVAHSCHFGMNDLRQNTDARIAWARDVGLTQMMVPTLAGPTENTSMDDVRRAADEFSAIGARMAAAGITAGIHNEGFELTTVEGRKTYDLLIESTDPDNVKFQFQCSTASRGYMAADYLRRYPGRFISMHVQDLGPGYQGQQPVGQGILPWREIFQAARDNGLRNYYIEMNLDLTRASVPFLQTLSV